MMKFFLNSDRSKDKLFDAVIPLSQSLIVCEYRKDVKQSIQCDSVIGPNTLKYNAISSTYSLRLLLSFSLLITSPDFFL